MAAVGYHPFHYSSSYMAGNFNPPQGLGNGSGSDSGSRSASYSLPLGEAQSDQPLAPFDLSEYILMESGAIIPPPLMQRGGGPSSAPLLQVQGGMMGTSQKMENAVFQAVQNSAGGGSVPISSSDTSMAVVMERLRTERIAFRMQSEIDVVDDGYKWRKYGKKAVKNSPNPRNYYRCSTEGCSVKKRVERDKDDQSYVITTYDGVHNHVCPTVVYDARQDATSGRYYVAGMHMPPASQGN